MVSEEFREELIEALDELWYGMGLEDLEYDARGEMGSTEIAQASFKKHLAAFTKWSYNNTGGKRGQRNPK